MLSFLSSLPIQVLHIFDIKANNKLFYSVLYNMGFYLHKSSKILQKSFQKVTLFLQYKIFHRDVIRLHFCLFEDVTDCRDLRRISF